MYSLEQIKNDKELFDIAVRQITPEIIGSVTDNTILNPVASKSDIEKKCDETDNLSSFICVYSSQISDVRNYTEKQNLMRIRGIAAVIDFPLGAGLTREKEAGALGALVDERADEIDMVLDFRKLREDDIDYVQKDIAAVAKMTRCARDMSGKKKILKVIQENCYLEMWHKHTATVIIGTVAEEVGIHMFAKTATGFGTPAEGTPKGATLDDVYHMNRDIQIFKDRGVLIGVKAANLPKEENMAEIIVKMMLAGGCFDDNVKLVSNPSDVFRIGASDGTKNVNDFKERFC